MFVFAPQAHIGTDDLQFILLKSALLLGVSFEFGVAFRALAPASGASSRVAGSRKQGGQAAKLGWRAQVRVPEETQALLGEAAVQRLHAHLGSMPVCGLYVAMGVQRPVVVKGDGKVDGVGRRAKHRLFCPQLVQALGGQAPHTDEPNAKCEAQGAAEPSVSSLLSSKRKSSSL